MIRFSLDKLFVFSLIGITVAGSISVISNSLTYGYVEFDVFSSDGSNDRYITNSQSSSQGSYCYAPPNASIIDSCNSGDYRSSDNSGYNIFEK